MLLYRSVKKLFLPFRILALAFLVLVMMGSLTNIIHASEPESSPEEQSEFQATPYQMRLLNWVIQRRIDGLPAADIEYDYQIVDNQDGNSSDGNVQIIGTTTLYFEGPEEAGYEVWPELFWDGVNYTDTISQAIEAEAPDIWDTYEFGKEPRTIEVVEEIIIPDLAAMSVLAEAMTSGTTTRGDVLMGFTLDGPNWDYTISQTVSACRCVIIPGTFFTPEIAIPRIEVFHFSAGFTLNFDVGLRLPASVELHTPTTMTRGQSYRIESELNAENWSSSQFEAVGASGMNGNEFVFDVNVSLGITVRILGGNVCAGCALVDFGADDASRSFTTPLGDARFPTDLSLDIPVWQRTFRSGSTNIADLELGVAIRPQFGSRNISAEWEIDPDIGSGTVSYSRSGVIELLDEIDTCELADDVTEVEVSLSNFRYYFDQFELNFSAYAQIEIYPITLPSSGACPICIEWEFDPIRVESPTIFSVDVDEIFSDLDISIPTPYVEDHRQCDLTIFPPSFACTERNNTISRTIPIEIAPDTPPETTIGLSGTRGFSGWYRSDVDVSLAATDFNPEAGCGGSVDIDTFYRIDGGDWIAYTGGFALTEDGIYEIDYYSVDGEGNVEPTDTRIVRIDTVAPTITGIASPPPNDNGWNNTSVRVSFTSSDSLSGILYATRYRWLTREGVNRSATGCAYDRAGNRTCATVDGINIDRTAPTISGVATPPPNEFGWNNTDVTVTFTGNDGLSGVDTLTAPVTLTEDGLNQSVTGTVTDMAGNTAQSTVYAINIDQTPPTITGVVEPPPNDNGWNNTDVTVTFIGDDNLSGVNTLTDPVTLTEEGEGQSVDGTVTDYAGNSTDLTVDNINIDLTPPVLTIISPTAGEYYKDDGLPLDWDASDALSGVDSVTALLEGMEASDGETLILFLIPAGTSYTLEVVVIDLAGNETRDSVTFTIITDIDGLGATVDYMCDMGLISQPGICNALRMKILNASRALDRCQPHVAANILRALMNQVEAQSGGHIDEEAADTLLIDTQYVIDHLPEGCSAAALTNAFPEFPALVVNEDILDDLAIQASTITDTGTTGTTDDAGEADTGTIADTPTETKDGD